ncbi:MAG: ferric reductase-like transmembrane domain-containing protein [Betaproteobacteria bacterium]|nr:ferric reductase-like transmembrane domain-containing protein [Betaproteobacteria bacterium]
MSPVVAAVFWICVYLGLVSAPLFLLLVGPMPPGVGLWWDLSMALGFAGLAIMGVQFALTARFRHASAPFGIDIIYYFHRLAAIIGIGLLLFHYAILRITYPDTLGALDPLQAPRHMMAGRVALVLFGILIVTSLWRKLLRIDYEHWRVAHALLATAGLILAVVHIEGVGYYTAAPWKRGLWIGYTLIWVFLIAYVRLIKPWRMLKTPYRVVEVRPERGRTWTLALAPAGLPGAAVFPLRAQANE